jgi:hypothetical protein
VFAPTNTADAARSPVINSGFADRPVEPTHFSPGYPTKELTYTTVNNYVRSIKWSSWGGKEAIGTGQVSLLHGERFYESVTWLPEETSPVTVRLGGLRNCLGVPVYTTYSLTLAPGAEAPMGWPQGQQGYFPCHAESGYRKRNEFPRDDCQAYYGLEQERVAPSNGDHFSIELRWKPKAPARNFELCHLRLKHWGAPVATMIGSATGQFEGPIRDVIWPVRLELKDPTWCPGGAGVPSDGTSPITYGAIRLTLYGKGTDFLEWVDSKQGDPMPSVGWLSTPRGKPHVYWQRLKSKGNQCLVGLEVRNPVYTLGG